MAFFVIPSRRTRQPSGPTRLNPGHWYVNSNLRSVVTNTGGGWVSPTNSTLAFAAPVTAVTKWGIAKKFNGTSSRLSFPVDLSSGKASLTMLLGGATQNGEMIAEYTASADSNNGFYVYGISSSQLRFQMRASGNSQLINLSYTLPTEPTWHTFEIDCSVNPRLCRIYANGLLAIDGSVAVATGTFDNSTLYIGTRNNSSLWSDSTFGDIYAYDGNITADQVADLHRYPFGIYVPDARRVYFGTGAGGGPTAYAVDAQPGTFAVNGTAATLARGLALNAQPGAFAVNGTAATLARGLVVNAQPGAFAVNGTAATLEKTTAGAFTIDAQPGTFSISGTAATLAYGRKFDAQPGTFSLSGTAATLTKNAAQAFELDAQPGTFALTGAAATLTYNGASIWTDVGASSTTWGDVSASSTTWSDL